MTGGCLAIGVVKSFQFLRTKNCCQEIKEMVQTNLPKTIKPMKRKVPHHLSGSTTAVSCAQTRNLASQDFRVATAKGFEWWTTWQKQEEQSKRQNLVKIGMVSGFGFSVRNGLKHELF